MTVKGNVRHLVSTGNLMRTEYSISASTKAQKPIKYFIDARKKANIDNYGPASHPS